MSGCSAEAELSCSCTAVCCMAAPHWSSMPCLPVALPVDGHLCTTSALWYGTHWFTNLHWALVPSHASWFAILTAASSPQRPTACNTSVNLVFVCQTLTVTAPVTAGVLQAVNWFFICISVLMSKVPDCCLLGGRVAGLVCVLLLSTVTTSRVWLMDIDAISAVLPFTPSSQCHAHCCRGGLSHPTATIDAAQVV